MKNKLKMALYACTITVGMIATTAQAATITYVGDLTSGVLMTSAGVHRNDAITPATWDIGNLWTLAVNAGDVVTVVARRLSNFDPIMSVWQGVETDTAAYTGYYASSAHSTLIGSDDDTLPANVRGSARFGDPKLTFTAATTGLYTVGVFGLGSGRRNADYTYSVQATGATGNVSPVPLPASMTLILAALGGLGLVARRRKAA